MKLREIFEGAYLGKRIHDGIFGAIIVIAFAVAGLYQSYVISNQYSPWLFVSVTTILAIVFLGSLRKCLKGKLGVTDLLGNTITTAIVGYFAIAVIASILTT